MPLVLNGVVGFLYHLKLALLLHKQGLVATGVAATVTPHPCVRDMVHPLRYVIYELPLSLWRLPETMVPACMGATVCSTIAVSPMPSAS